MNLRLHSLFVAFFTLSLANLYADGSFYKSYIDDLHAQDAAFDRLAFRKKWIQIFEQTIAGNTHPEEREQILNELVALSTTTEQWKKAVVYSDVLKGSLSSPEDVAKVTVNTAEIIIASRLTSGDKASGLSVEEMEKRTVDAISASSKVPFRIHINFLSTALDYMMAKGRYQNALALAANVSEVLSKASQQQRSELPQTTGPILLDPWSPEAYILKQLQAAAALKEKTTVMDTFNKIKLVQNSSSCVKSFIVSEAANIVDPDHGDVYCGLLLTWHKSAMPDAYSHRALGDLGIALLSAKKYEAAIKVFTEVLKSPGFDLNSANSDVKRFSVGILQNLEIAFQNAGDTPNAEKLKALIHAATKGAKQP